MALVDYSDSDGSGDEQPPPQPKAPAKSANTNFSIDRAHPQKIRVKLNEAAPSKTDDEEPAPKRARLGGGSSGFNAMLPAPKRTAEKPAASKAPARKVFSLKTGAEPGFSRESDSELRQLFDEQDTNGGVGVQEDVTIPEIPKRTVDEAPKTNAFMFKPLSVARNPNKKKKAASAASKGPSETPPDHSQGPLRAPATAPQSTDPTPPPKKKLNLFTKHSDADSDGTPLAPDPIETLEEDPHPDNGVTADCSSLSAAQPSGLATASGHSQSLDSIASDLNLSAAERRQLFGRNAHPSSVSQVINFNTDAEYAANEVLRQNGETAQQHNPVRPIAPGKHSLRQLMTAAQGQKDALEESFAEGRRNKREAGNKYGW